MENIPNKKSAKKVKKKRGNYFRDEKALKLIGKNIKEIRNQQDLSQEQLAYESKIPRRQIQRIEKGEVNAGISTLLAIAQAFDVHIKEFFEF